MPMRVDALSIQLRPRPMAEAADLGVLLVRTHARSVWLTFGPVFAVVFLAALATIDIAPWLPTFIIFWLKPWLDRSLLFVLSRAAFGQETRFADLWRDRGSVWWREWLETLLWRRLSPWRSFTQPIHQLEGQRGKVGRKRRAVLLRAKRGAAAGMHVAFAHVELALYGGALAVVVWLAPEGAHRHLLTWLFDSDASGNQLVLAALYGAVVLALEPFYVAAGFAMYLNRRVELEAWDVEQEFRRAFAA
jgi:hypothetical protein